MHSNAAVSGLTAGSNTQNRADEDMQEVLDTLSAMDGKAIESLDPVEARKQPTPSDAVSALVSKQEKSTAPTPPRPGMSSMDFSIKGIDGPLPVRVYTPPGKGPFPVVVYFHGGGWVLADKDVYAAGARSIATKARAVVVSVDYRLAPEAPFPAQHEDALVTYRWAVDHAASMNGDPKRMAIAGESAGGNLAIATAIAARDRELTMPLHIVSVYPIAQASNFSTPSYLDSADASPLNKPMMEWFAKHVFENPEDRSDPRIDLLNADLKGLPPVTLINARIDPLRSDGDMLAQALEKAGVKITHRIYDGVTHEFFGMAAVVEKALEAQDLAGKQLREAFEEPAH